MAMFVPGMVCSICGKPMEEADKVVMFPPFVANRIDPLYQFSDSVFHAVCFGSHPLAKRASEIVETMQQRLQPGRRFCAACGEPILDPDDYFTSGYLTGDPNNRLFEYNYIQLHRSHLGEWSEFSEFRRLVEEYQSSDEWEGPRLSLVPLNE